MIVPPIGGFLIKAIVFDLPTTAPKSATIHLVGLYRSAIAYVVLTQLLTQMCEPMGINKSTLYKAVVAMTSLKYHAPPQHFKRIVEHGIISPMAKSAELACLSSCVTLLKHLGGPQALMTNISHRLGAMLLELLEHQQQQPIETCRECLVIPTCPLCLSRASPPPQCLPWANSAPLLQPATCHVRGLDQFWWGVQKWIELGGFEGLVGFSALVRMMVHWVGGSWAPHYLKLALSNRILNQGRGGFKCLLGLRTCKGGHGHALGDVGSRLMH